MQQVHSPSQVAAAAGARLINAIIDEERTLRIVPKRAAPEPMQPERSGPLVGLAGRDRYYATRLRQMARLELDEQQAGELWADVVRHRAELSRRLGRDVGAQVALLEEAEYLYTMQTLALVEGAATAMAAPLLTADHLIRARAINARMIDCLDHFEPLLFTELNLEFHSVLFEECPNPHILDLVHRGWSRLTVLRDSSFSFVPGRARESVAEHETLLQLIESGADPLEVELAARRHRTATLDAVLAHQAGHKHPIAS
jgi:DNA-binding GntR family transcriptional regulator